VSPVLPPFQRGEGFGTLGSSFVEPTLPPAISLAPATWQAWLTLVLLGLGVVALAAWLVRRKAQRRYRRQARRELRALQTAWRSAAGEARGRTLERLPLVLKGCALGSFERTRVAALSGRAWLEFLRKTAPAAGFQGATGEALAALCERGAPGVPETSVPALFAAAERWIAGHHV
jgi:Domain of unknown function (DUF4381)